MNLLLKDNEKLYQRVSLIALILYVIVYTGSTIWLGRGPHTDEAFFKAAGLSWAKGGPWVAEEFTGFFSHLDCKDLDEVFFSYPPGYPFLFGIFVKLFGFGWKTCVLFDALIHVGLLAAIAYLFKHASPVTNRHKWSLTLLFVLIGHPGRPDELAMIFGYMGLALGLQNHSSKQWLSHAAFGLCGLVSVPCLIILGGIRFGYVVFSGDASKHRVKLLTQSGLVVAGMWIIGTSPITLNYPGALTQNYQTTFAHIGRDFLESIKFLFTYYRADVVATSTLIMLGVLNIPRSLKTGKMQHWSQWWALSLVTYLFFLFKNTFQGNYYIFWMPWLVMALFKTKDPISSNEKSIYLQDTFSYIKVPLMVIMLLYVNVSHARHWLISMLAVSEQRWQAESPRIRSLIPPGSSVLTDEHWWSIGDITNVRSSMTPAHIDLENLDYIILTGHGSGTAGAHRPLPEKFQNAIDSGRFKVIYNNIPVERPMLFGIPLSNSSWGAGAIIYSSVKQGN